MLVLLFGLLNSVVVIPYVMACFFVWFVVIVVCLFLICLIVYCFCFGLLLVVYFAMCLTLVVDCLIVICLLGLNTCAFVLRCLVCLLLLLCAGVVLFDLFADVYCCFDCGVYVFGYFLFVLFVIAALYVCC